MPIQHALERRSKLLAGVIKTRVGALSQSFTAAQGRAPYKDKLSEAAALEWWSTNRYTALGAKALASLDPAAIANLDAELTKYAQQKEALGLPTVTDATTPPPTPDAGVPPPPPGGGMLPGA